MKRMLVGVDGSEPARRAAWMAADLAKTQGSSLVLCFVCVPINYPVETGWAMVPEMDKAQREYGQEILAKWAKELASAGVWVTTQLLDGTAAESLIRRAEEDDIDLVVVGSHGRKALGRFLLGSVADRVVHVCRKPVLIVHEPAAEKTQGN